MNKQDVINSLTRIANKFFSNVRIVDGEVNGLPAIGFIGDFMDNVYTYSFNAAHRYWLGLAAENKEIELELENYLQAMQEAI